MAANAGRWVYSIRLLSCASLPLSHSLTFSLSAYLSFYCGIIYLSIHSSISFSVFLCFSIVIHFIYSTLSFHVPARCWLSVYVINIVLIIQSWKCDLIRLLLNPRQRWYQRTAVNHAGRSRFLDVRIYVNANIKHTPILIQTGKSLIILLNARSGNYFR